MGGWVDGLNVLCHFGFYSMKRKDMAIRMCRTKLGSLVAL